MQGCGKVRFSRRNRYFRGGGGVTTFGVLILAASACGRGPSLSEVNGMFRSIPISHLSSYTQVVQRFRVACMEYLRSHFHYLRCKQAFRRVCISNRQVTSEIPWYTKRNCCITIFCTMSCQRKYSVIHYQNDV